MPAIGGRPDQVSPQGIAEALQGVAWSADGTALAHMRREPDANFIEIVSALETREVRRLRVPGEQGNRLDLSWSPNGRFFAYSPSSEPGAGIYPTVGAAHRRRGGARGDGWDVGRLEPDVVGRRAHVVFHLEPRRKSRPMAAATDAARGSARANPFRSP